MAAIGVCFSYQCAVLSGVVIITKIRGKNPSVTTQVKVKSNPFTGLEGSRRMRLPDFKTIGI
jgi:hypothetical protein